MEKQDDIAQRIIDLKTERKAYRCDEGKYKSLTNSISRLRNQLKGLQIIVRFITTSYNDERREKLDEAASSHDDDDIDKDVQ